MVTKQPSTKAKSPVKGGPEVPAVSEESKKFGRQMRAYRSPEVSNWKSGESGSNFDSNLREITEGDKARLVRFFPEILDMKV